jgi:hypothetical protein
MVERALAAGARPDWGAADEVYGNDSYLRVALEDLGVGYVLAVSCWQIRSAWAGAKGQRLSVGLYAPPGAVALGPLVLTRHRGEHISHE